MQQYSDRVDLQMKKKQIIKLIIVSLIALLGVFSVFWKDVIDKNINRYLSSRNIYQSQQKLSVHFIDVGEADAIAIKFPNGEVGLIDSGDEDDTENVMSYIYEHIINDKKSKKINYLFFTHCDNDHIGGLKRIVNHYDVQNVYRPRQYCSFEQVEDEYGYLSTSEIYADAISTINEKGVHLTTVVDNMELFVGTAKIKLFRPYKKYLASNDYSYFIKITYQNQSILFTGDASSTVENDVIALHENELQSDYLKVAHHGSKFSSSAQFLAIVQPQVAIISVGTNMYGHPTEAVISRLQEVGAEILRTDIEGSILVNIGQSSTVFLSNYFEVSFIWKYGTLVTVVEIVCIIVIIKEVVLTIKSNKKSKKILTKV